MKSIILIIAMILLFGCNDNPQQIIYKTKIVKERSWYQEKWYKCETSDREEESNKLNYDPVKDAYIRNVILTQIPNIQISGCCGIENYSITYTEFRIIMTHYRAIEYQSKDTYDYSCNLKDGTMVLIHRCVTPINNISDLTKELIKSIAIGKRKVTTI